MEHEAATNKHKRGHKRVYRNLVLCHGKDLWLAEIVIEDPAKGRGKRLPAPVAAMSPCHADIELGRRCNKDFAGWGSIRSRTKSRSHRV